MMHKVRREEILDYQTYIERREQIRAAVLPVKQARRIHLGDTLTFLFENAETVRYQIQEMMRTEQIVKEEAIVHEIDTYNELLGDEGELGCVLLIEIDDPAERDLKLRAWLDLPRHLYVGFEDGERAYAQFDARQVGEERVSSVQYLKFRTGGRVPTVIGSDLPDLSVESWLTEDQRKALNEDLTTKI